MKRTTKMLCVFLSAVLLLQGPVFAEEPESPQPNTVVINEVESDAPDKGNDWVEIVNIGSQPIDISGWYLTDDKELERKSEGKTTPFSAGTVLEPGAFLVLEENVHFDFGLGKADSAVLYNQNDKLVDRYDYIGVAVGTWSRQSDGSFVDAEATPGAANATSIAPDPAEPSGNPALVLNEINSSPDDWVELMNVGEEALDLGGFELRDNSDDHRWRFPKGSTLAAGELLVVDAKSNGLIYDDTTNRFLAGTFEAAIGIGSGDAIRLYDKEGNVLDEYSWTEHASYDGDPAKASYGRYPDGAGTFCLTKETRGLANDRYVPDVVINEVESNGDVIDWVEVLNVGTQPVDISGWHLLDNDPVGHKADVTPVPEGTTLAPGTFYVFDQNKDFTFGLGKADEATIYDAGGNIVAQYRWTSHANGVYARIPDGSGDFQDFSTATKGKRNKIVNPVVINEVQSKDPAGGPDWIELANPTAEALDISGLVLLDEKEKDPYTIPTGTTIPANGFLVIYQDDNGVNGFAFGLGKGDSVRLLESGQPIAATTWSKGSHTAPTWGVYPDVNGTTYKNTSEPTPGAPNKFAGIPEIVAWPGSDEVRVFDTTPTFLEDSSGLDFANGKLYAVDNGTATFWIIDVAKDGTMAFAPGFELGKRIGFRRDVGNEKAKGPDAEGITVDGDGMVYIASERDNSAKGVNYNSILTVDPNGDGTVLTAQKEWDLTGSLPQVSANMGIEAVEWVSNADVIGKLLDQNTGAAFDAANYPDAVANGVFFVALEDNGHVYAYVLNADETVVQIADIDSKLGGAMALDYDTYEHVLWVAADDGYGNRMAKISLSGHAEPAITHVLPAAGVDTAANNEGFAILDASYTMNGQRPVYRFCDGVASGALTVGSLDCDYKALEEPGPDETTAPEKPDPGASTEPGNPSEEPTPEKPQVSIEKPTTAPRSSTFVASGTPPKTGDTNPLRIWLGLVMLSAGTLVLLAVVRRRKVGNRQ